MTPLGDRAATAWTTFYTRGLPDETAERRRAEIASDLFEHAHEAGPTPAQQTEVLGRVLWGIPADLSWRRAARAPRERRLVTGEAMTLRKITFGAFAVYALFNLWAGVGIIGGGYWPWGLSLLVASALIVIALRQRDDAPRRSTILLIVAPALTALTLYWMIPIFGPVWLLLSWMAYATEPGRRDPVPVAAT